jgi:formylglycine-generating enzyme required for sulfatase activity
MSGNVFEWTHDWYDEYASGAAVDPVGASSGSFRALRGGSWGYDPAYARVDFRSIIAPSSRYSFLGVRLARSVP